MEKLLIATGIESRAYGDTNATEISRRSTAVAQAASPRSLSSLPSACSPAVRVAHPVWSLSGLWDGAGTRT